MKRADNHPIVIIDGHAMNSESVGAIGVHPGHPALGAEPLHPGQPVDGVSHGSDRIRRPEHGASHRGGGAAVTTAGISCADLPTTPDISNSVRPASSSARVRRMTVKMAIRTFHWAGPIQFISGAAQ
jgi:hypothetical protein